MSEPLESSGPGAPAPRPDAVASLAALVAAREAAGLQPADVAQRLKLAPRQVEALERGDWSSLPGQAFVRGALRSYGRLLGTNVDPLLQSLGAGAAAAELRPATSLEEPLPSRSMLGFGGGGGGSKSAWFVLGAIVLVAVALFFGRDGDISRIPSWLSSAAPDKPAAPASGKVIETVPLPDLATASRAAGSTAGGSPPVPAGSASTVTPGAPAPGGASSAAAGAAPTVDASAPGSATGAAASGAPAGANDPAGAARGLRLVFEKAAWVEIKQADGKVLLYGEQKAGSESRVPLEAPVSLVIGNAEHVRLERHGEPVDLKGQARQGVAKLKLAP